MTILPVLDAAIRSQRQLDALARLAADAQRIVAELSRIVDIPSIRRMQADVQPTVDLARRMQQEIAASLPSKETLAQFQASLPSPDVLAEFQRTTSEAQRQVHDATLNTMVPKGRCHLCGEEKGLTYEHVPARSSFNDSSAEMFGFESWLGRSSDGEMTDGDVKERGAGAHTLCYRCNTEITGDHYVAELKRWTRIGMSVAQKSTQKPDGNAVEITIQRAYPARLLKQIVAMLASVNSVSLLDHHRSLREYVMSPEAIGLPERYQFYLLVTHPTSSIARYGGLTVALAPGTWCGLAHLFA
jgi:hypothetical protein